MIIWLLTLLAGIAAALFAFQHLYAAAPRRSKPFEPPVTRLRAPAGQRRRPRHFYASELVPGPDACLAASRAAGERMLMENAPPLPLKGCATQVCHCRHRPLDDLRSGIDRPDRLLAFGEFDAEFNRNDRQSSDRRARQV